MMAFTMPRKINRCAGIMAYQYIKPRKPCGCHHAVTFRRRLSPKSSMVNSKRPSPGPFIPNSKDKTAAVGSGSPSKSRYNLPLRVQRQRDSDESVCHHQTAHPTIHEYATEYWQKIPLIAAAYSADDFPQRMAA